MRAHDDAVDLALAEECENLVGGQSRPHHDFAANAGIAHALGQRLKVAVFRAGRGRIVVVADARRLRRGDDQRVIGMEKNEIGAEFRGLRQCKIECLFVGGNLGSKENGGGFAPTRLDYACHGNLLDTRKDSNSVAAGLSVSGSTSPSEINHTQNPAPNCPRTPFDCSIGGNDAGFCVFPHPCQSTLPICSFA